MLDVISVYQYNDTEDRFEREPFSVQFRTKEEQEGQHSCKYSQFRERGGEREGGRGLVSFEMFLCRILPNGYTCEANCCTSRVGEPSPCLPGNLYIFW